MAKNKFRITESDFLLANRKASREEEIARSSINQHVSHGLLAVSYFPADDINSFFRLATE